MDKCRTTTDPLTGELVVRNGPDKGVSRHLLVPVTLVGSSETCDLRIIDLTVRSVHCAVSVTPEGPHLRSIGGTTPVNDVPASTRLLKNGDIVKVGPVELEVHWTLPPAPQPNSEAQPVPPLQQIPPTMEPTGAFPEVPARKSAQWRTRLIAGRKDLLRERAELKEDFERQLVDLAHARDAADTARAHAEQELAHLQVLRRRFLRRWKKHWATERMRHQTQVERLARERIHFERDRITHEGERVAFTAKRDQLVAWQDEYRQRVKTLEQELTRRETEFTKREQAFAQEEEAFRQEKATFERRRAELTTELEGLDSRIRHTRTQLPDSGSTPPAEQVASPSPEESSLQASVQELADQRRILTEQVTRMTDVVGDLRVQEQSLVNDLQNLAQELTRVEENIQRESGQAIASRAILQARQTFITQAEIELRTRQQQLERQERAWERMLRMQTKQQERDLATIREQLMEANRLRESAAAAAARNAATSLEMADDRQRLDSALLALEKAKKAFLEKDEKRKRVLARLERKLEAGRNKAHLELDRRAAAIESESAALEILHSHVVARLEQLEQARREWLAIQAEQSKIAARASVESPRTATEEAQAQQIEELRRELERLAEAVEPCLDGSLQVHRAA